MRLNGYRFPRGVFLDHTSVLRGVQRGTGLARAACFALSLFTAGCLSPERARDLRCAELTAGARAQAVCRAAEDTLRLSFYGHLFPMPGYSFPADAVRDVYCGLHITRNDAELLARMRDDPKAEGRAHVMASHLHALLTPAEQYEHSIYTPGTPGYLLREGCPESSRR
jgi:hypothetical protein